MRALRPPPYNGSDLAYVSDIPGCGIGCGMGCGSGCGSGCGLGCCANSTPPAAAVLAASTLSVVSGSAAQYTAIDSAQSPSTRKVRALITCPPCDWTMRLAFGTSKTCSIEAGGDLAGGRRQRNRMLTR